MIIAGIDEAGLGPTLGPLVTASCAIHCPPNWTPETPWKTLPETFTQTPQNSFQPLAICDSKRIYPSHGLLGLEAALGVFQAILEDAPAPGAITSYPEIPIHPCYDSPLPFPAACAATDIAQTARSVRDALNHAGANLIHLEIHVLHEPAFNHILSFGLNKNHLLLEQTGRHLTTLVHRFAATDPMLIVVDKQGGRNAYAPYLASLFPETWPRERETGRECSRYSLQPGPHTIEVRFQAKADQTSFCTAAASMAAKYFRECAMSQLNSWFTQKIPDLKPTAGYPLDAKRWLAEVKEKDPNRNRGKELLLDKIVRLK